MGLIISCTVQSWPRLFPTKQLVTGWASDFFHAPGEFCSLSECHLPSAISSNSRAADFGVDNLKRTQPCPIRALGAQAKSMLKVPNHGFLKVSSSPSSAQCFRGDAPGGAHGAQTLLTSKLRHSQPLGTAVPQLPGQLKALPSAPSILANTGQLELQLSGEGIDASSDKHAGHIESCKPCWGFPRRFQPDIFEGMSWVCPRRNDHGYSGSSLPQLCQEWISQCCYC